ncbi:DUF1707 domain-containing protein [Plantactinospora mayteni]|uniref:Cell wall-active antibiotics response LiaF-like C-terminal domain-containing protein n=1 Tax=Plantactinospora mayteni TaxID=566021 RepID=A0ABQ4ESA4_9ACTN|nr:DUF1707 domain-containing protein [Plantactinospora mayteni]GIG97505.1 hypothetical protein Pma05_40780 [Plantactinospora mayteni]
MEREPQDDADRIRVSDREREQVVELLGTAAAEGRLTLDEYADRATAAHAAKTRGELARLTDDLPTDSTGAPVPARRSESGVAEPAPERLVAIFGNESRKGRWPVPARLEAQSIFGECHIELQDTTLSHPVVTIEATAIFGSVTIFVPEGVEVRLTGTAIFGSKESKLRGTAPPGGPVLEVNSKVIFGSVTVRPPKRRWR